MLLDGKPLDQLTEDDLRSLIGREAERKTLDFKKELHLDTDGQKKEFLADVTSFANSAGGYLVIGMDEAEGVATDLPGIAVYDPDAEKLKIESIVRDGVRPRIPGVQIELIGLTNGNFAAVLRVSKSWVSPHMVVFKNNSRFYSRNSAGKYQLDVDELRSAFLLSETLGERIREFRLERINRINLAETPVLLRSGENGLRLILHLIPISSFSSNSMYNLPGCASSCSSFIANYSGLMPEWHFNYDGVVFHYDGASEYHQLFRNGIIEIVDGFSEEDKQLLFSEYEKLVLGQLKKMLVFQQSILIECPVIIFVSMIGAGGLHLDIDRRRPRYREKRVDRDVLILPEVSLQSYREIEFLPTMLKPVFDIVANAASFAGSPSFDDGNWRYYDWFARI